MHVVVFVFEQVQPDDGFVVVAVCALIVHHPTQINDPDIQGMIGTGQIELIRMELDNGPPS
ncbi:hypothetical protein AB0M12_33715 [Nocardia vinacea]